MASPCSQVYYGAPADLPAYCTSLGKSPPAFSNTGEFFLEVVDEYEAADNVKVRLDRGRKGAGRSVETRDKQQTRRARRGVVAVGIKR